MNTSGNDIIARFAPRIRSGLFVACLLAALAATAVSVDVWGAEVATAEPAEASQAAAAAQPEAASEAAVAAPDEAATPADTTVVVTDLTASPNGSIRMSFQDAPLRAVLTYLSESAGLVIVEPNAVEGRVTVTSRRTLSAEEAIALLDTLLLHNGYASIHNGRTITIVPLEDAGTSNVPVHVGNDPEAIEPTDRVVTQIIPVQCIKAAELRDDLASLFPESATVTSNEGSNSLIVTDSQTHIRRIVQIVRALDQHLSTVAEVRVFQLTYADARSTAELITQVFQPDESRSTRNQLGGFAGRMQMMMRGRGGRGGRGGGGDQSENEGAVAQRVVASADERTNAVVVSAPPELLTVIEGVIKELDSNPAAEQTVFLYYLKNAQAETVAEAVNDIFSEDTQNTATGRTGARTGGRNRQSGAFRRTGRGTAAQAAAGSGGLVGDVFIVADEDTNSLLVRTSSANVDTVKDILADLDRSIPQVLIKVLIAEVAHEDLLDVGGQFSALNLRLGESGEYTVDLGGSTSSGGFLTTTLNSSLSATFEALQRDGKLDVLSRPYILASDNQEASIIVGEEVPFITNTRITDDGQTLNTIEYEDIGIILTVTPHINPQGVVIMDVAPEISSITDTTVPISETVDATVFSKRSASTRIAVADGQTIVIGGLMEDSVQKFVRKVPLLGDIPLLGGLFRRTVENKVKTELLIFLTPLVAEGSTDLAEISTGEAAAATGLREAVGEGVFDAHMERMQRGVSEPPPGESDGSAR